MHICYVSDERFPSTHTDTQQVAMTIDALSRHGAKIDLVAPRYTKGEYSEDQEGALRTYYGVGDGFDVHFVKTVDPERRSWVKTFHPFAAMKAVKRIRADLVYTRNLQIAFMALSRGHRLAFESYRVVDRRFPRLARFYARWARSDRFLGVITHSAISAESFVRCGVPEEKIRVVHNGYSADQMLPRLDRQDARKKCGLPLDKTLAVYTGHINPKKGIETLAQLAVATPEVTHVWVGGAADGATEYAESCVQEAGAENVILAGWVAPHLLPAYLYAADVLLIPPTSQPFEQHGNTVLPMKTFAYMAGSRAILAPNLPDLREVLVHGENAWLVTPNELQEAADALMKIVNDHNLRDRLGNAAEALSRDYTWDARAGKILSFLKERGVGGGRE